MHGWWHLLLLYSLVCVVRADIVLLRYAHGNDAMRHRDVIECAALIPPLPMPHATIAARSKRGAKGTSAPAPTGATEPHTRIAHNADAILFEPALMLARVFLPDALWCDEASHCHDRTSARDYVATSIVCSNSSSEVRCTALIDCAPLVEAFWQSLGGTLACIVIFVLVLGMCIDSEEARRQRTATAVSSSSPRSLAYYDKDTSL